MEEGIEEGVRGGVVLQGGGWGEREAERIGGRGH